MLYIYTHICLVFSCISIHTNIYLPTCLYIHTYPRPVIPWMSYLPPVLPCTWFLSHLKLPEFLYCPFLAEPNQLSVKQSWAMELKSSRTLGLGGALGNLWTPHIDWWLLLGSNGLESRQKSDKTEGKKIILRLWDEKQLLYEISVGRKVGLGTWGRENSEFWVLPRDIYTLTFLTLVDPLGFLWLSSFKPHPHHFVLFPAITGTQRWCRIKTESSWCMSALRL